MGSSEKSVHVYFNHLIQRVLDRQVVPFLGAGISTPAKHPDEMYENINNTNTMIRNVTNSIAANCTLRIVKEKNNAKCACCIINRQLFCHVENDGKLKLCELIGTRFAEFGNIKCSLAVAASEQECLNKINSPSSTLTSICEMWEWGCKERGERTDLVRDVLHINEFNNLEPTNAHRYLAYLAREFLIDEVITTNYDACLEKAYRQSFEDKNDNKIQMAVVISSLPQYRAKSGKRYEKRQEDRRVNVLKIFKINGDAGAYEQKLKKDQETINWAQSILLTEADLQNWRERYWAQDLFRDRLRSRTILFCGFGSDEPQVRHTVLQICEEFSVSENDQMERKVEDKQRGNSNAPFLAVYEDTLSFNQHQILQAFSSKLKKTKTTAPLELLFNVFSGNDRKFFQSDNQVNEKSESTLPAELSADLFFERVYQTAFGKLLSKVDNPDSPTYQYLMAINPSLLLLLHELNKWMYQEDIQKPFGQFSEILQIGNALTNFSDMKSTLLSQWVYTIRYGVPPKPCSEKGDGIYMALADRQVLIITTLLLFYLLFARQNRTRKTVDGIEQWGSISYANGLGLKIKAKPQSTISYDIYLAHADCAQQLSNLNYHEEGMCVDLNRPGIQIVLGNGFSHPRKAQVYVEDIESEERAVKTIYQIPFAYLFKNYMVNEKVGLPSCLESFHKILKYPSIVTDKSLQTRSYELLSIGGM